MPSPNGHQHQRFHSTVSARKLRRLNTVVLLLRFAAFCFSFASAAFMAADPSAWLHSEPFRVVLFAGGIVAVYSLAEMGAAVWEILRGTTVLPEATQLWFDFAHDQVFAYLLASAAAAGAVEVTRVKKEGGSSVQLEISVALGFAGFVFVAVATLASAFRLACYLITGSRYHL